MSMLLNIPNCPYNFRVRTFSYQFFCDIFPVASVTASHIIIKNNLSGINWQIRPFFIVFSCHQNSDTQRCILHCIYMIIPFNMIINDFFDYIFNFFDIHLLVSCRSLSTAFCSFKIYTKHKIDITAYVPLKSILLPKVKYGCFTE